MLGVVRCDSGYQGLDKRAARLLHPGHLLAPAHHGETYNDLGGDYFDKRRNSPTRERHMIAQLEALGHKVTLEPAA